MFYGINASWRRPKPDGISGSKPCRNFDLGIDSRPVCHQGYSNVGIGRDEIEVEAPGPEGPRAAPVAIAVVVGWGVASVCD